MRIFTKVLTGGHFCDITVIQLMTKSHFDYISKMTNSQYIIEFLLTLFEIYIKIL